MLKVAPGMWLLSRCDSSWTRSRLVFPAGQVEYGVSSINNSLRFGPKGSMPESLRPLWDITILTSGDCFGEMVKKILAEYKVNADFVRVAEARSTGVTVTATINDASNAVR